MYKYFKDCKTLEDVKDTYRKLCFKYHPDVSKEADALEIMKAVNNEYERAFKEFKNTHKTAENKTYTTKEENTETPEEFRNIIEKLIHMSGTKVELIGRWIWVSGDTRPYKEILGKELKFNWIASKMAWAWHKPEDKKRSQKKFNFDEIRDLFGSTEYKTEDEKQKMNS